VAHFGATQSLAVAPVSPPADAGRFRLFDTVNVSVESGGVKSVQFERDPAAVPLYAPNSPVANQDGMVALANVDLGTEIVDSILSSTLFKANLVTIGVADDMLGALLDRKV
jgi:flagellar basal-body rod protein FlgC